MLFFFYYETQPILKRSLYIDEINELAVNLEYVNLITYIAHIFICFGIFRFKICDTLYHFLTNLYRPTPFVRETNRVSQMKCNSYYDAIL